MRKIRDVLRLTAEGMSSRKIAASLSIGATTVIDCQRRARTAGLGWPLLEDMTDAVLEARLFPASTAAQAKSRRPMPRELKRSGVTLLLLWEEHRGWYLDGLGYSRFCEIFQEWKGRLTPTMRQTHIAGERMFVDCSGKKPHLVNATTGELIPVELFVAVLGASNFTYAEATWMTLAEWIGSHTRAFAFFGGVTALTVSDNLRGDHQSLLLRASSQPYVFRYGEALRHGDPPGTANKPRDKAKVGLGVQVTTRWIVAKLGNRTFFSLSELNEAIHALVVQINDRVTRHLDASRRALFEQLVLGNLPELALAITGMRRISLRVGGGSEFMPLYQTPAPQRSGTRCVMATFRGR